METQFIIFAVQVLAIVIIARQKNPYKKQTSEWKTIRLCKTGMCLAVASFGFGLVGFLLALVAFVLGVAGIIKGETFYGLRILAAAMILPAAGMIV